MRIQDLRVDEVGSTGKMLYFSPEDVLGPLDDLHWCARHLLAVAYEVGIVNPEVRDVLTQAAGAMQHAFITLKKLPESDQARINVAARDIQYRIRSRLNKLRPK